MQDESSGRIYRLKTVLGALVVAIIGAGLLFAARFVDQHVSDGFLHVLPLRDFGTSLLIAGIFGIGWDYYQGHDRDARDDARLRRLLKEAAPELRDAVVQGFAVSPEDLARVATPELLDSIAANALSLRLGERQFASELYADLLDQAIRTPERWYDVDVNIWLSPISEADAADVSLFAITVEWAYTVTPSHTIQRFACVSDLDEFHDLLSDVPATSTWFMSPRPGFDSSKREAFELVDFSVDGEQRPIRRQSHRSGQIYSAAIGDALVANAKPVRIRHTYRTITDPATHRLFVAIAQPARNVSVTVDYVDTEISRMSVTDFVASSRRPYVSRLPEGSGQKELSIEVPGWVQAGTGLTFVWTLASEEREPSQVPHSSGSKRAA